MDADGDVKLKAEVPTEPPAEAPQSNGKLEAEDTGKGQ